MIRQQAVLTRQFCFVACAMALSFSAMSQVSGTVTDAESGEPLIGASVLITGTTTGTITDLDGNFTINANEGDELEISYTGYVTQSVTVGAETDLSIGLTSGLVISEVVVTGYSSQRKRDITGAVAVVDAEDLNRISASSFTQKLEGQATGLAISTSGEPGEGTTVRVRGISSFQNNDPLYIIDGVPVQDAYNTGFNPNDIESIQVLKDASAASIYGSRANNGVIIITTKKGKSGKTRVTYDAYYGVQTPINDMDYLITDPADYSELLWRAHENAGIAVDANNPYSEGRGVLPTYSYPYGAGPVNEADYSYPDNLIMRANQSGTNWFDEVFNPSPVHEHNIGVSGGNQNGSYYFSAGYLDQEGTMDYTYFKRYSLRANTEFNKGRFTFGENFSLTRANGVGNDGINGGNQDEQGVMMWVTLMNPLTPIYDISGVNFAGDKSQGMSNGTNPVAEVYRNKDNEGTFNRILGNAFIDVELIPGLTARSSLGMDYYGIQRGAFDFPNPENREPSTTNGFSEDWDNGFTWTWTNTLAYTNTIADVHSLQALVGYEAIRSEWRHIDGGLNNYFTQDINAWYLNGGLADPGTRQVESWGGFRTLASLFGKVDYAYDDKYLASFTIRRDGSSNFGDDKYGVFPAFSVGWRIGQEDFLSNSSWLDDLKIRFGWGKTGNQVVPGGNAFDRFGGGTASTFYDITGSNNSIATGYALTDRGNKETKWEENVSTNIGVDLALFDGRVTFVADVYQRTVDGLLFPASLPGTAGTASPAFINIAEMENKGVDLGLEWKNQVSGDLSFSVGLTFSTYQNEIIDIDGSSEVFFPTGFDSRIGTVNINQVGYSISSFYGWTADGIFRSQAEVDAHAEQDGKKVGYIRFKDLNSDGVINDDDKGVIGDPHPDFTGGINLGVDFANFDLNVFLFAAVGNEVFNYVKLFDLFGQFNSNRRKELLTNSFPNGDLPILDVNDTYSRQPSSYYVEDASYLRAKTIQVGYTLPAGTFGDTFSSLRVYLQAQNLFTITGYDGLDPAPSNFGVQDSDPSDPNATINADLWNGFDFGNYPASRIFMIGVNAAF